MEQRNVVTIIREKSLKRELINAKDLTIIIAAIT